MKTKLYLIFRRYFVAGLFTLLPLWVTYVILKTLFGYVVRAVRPIIPTLPSFIERKYMMFLIDLGSVMVVLGVVCLIGFFATNFVGRRILVMFESFVRRVPLVSTVYFTIRRITQTFTADNSKFKSVVLVPFPKTGTYSIGFVTCESVGEVQQKTQGHVLNVFVPTTPNPTSGFLLMVDEKELVPLEMQIEDAVKLVITFGISAADHIPETVIRRAS